MHMLYKHTNARLFCDARPRLHVIRNDVEKITLGVTMDNLESLRTRAGSVVDRGQSGAELECFP